MSSPSASPVPAQDGLPALLCFGDSITANGHWVTAPEAAGPWRLINSGRAGRKTTDIPTEFPPTLAAHPEARGLLLFLGVNDLPARDPRSGDDKITACLANLQLALDLTRDRFALENIFLVAPCTVDPFSLDSTNREKGYAITPPLLAQLALGIEQLARTRRVRFINLNSLLGPGHFSDGLHPNAAGDALIAQAIGPALTNPTSPLPSFYVVGDSISIDYHEALCRECAGLYHYSRKGGLELARADLDHPQGANGGDSSAVLAHLREALQNTTAPDALPSTIVVNCGLHDLKTDPATGAHQVPLDAYRAHLAAITDLVRDSGRRLVWINTTPLDEQRHNPRSPWFHRFERDLAAYNAAALDIMTARNIPLFDLHTFTVTLGEPLFRDHVHFLPAVSQRQAAYLRRQLDALPW